MSAASSTRLSPAMYFDLDRLDGRADPQTFQFSPRVMELISRIRESNYTQKDIFLRELLANASDALDRIHFQVAAARAFRDPHESPNLWIRLVPDPASRTLTIWDSGVGMTKPELMTYFDAIFKAGTRTFLEALKANQFDQTLTHFGVGFFSAFLVAEAVAVVSKSDRDEQHVWTTAGADTFTIYRDTLGEPLARGTKVILRLRPRFQRLLEAETLVHLVDKQAEFIQWPIQLWQPDSSTWRQINDPSKPPVWLRPTGTVSRYEYFAFYRRLTGDTEDPLCFYHFTVESPIHFTALLFVPQHADLRGRTRRDRHPIRLFLKRVTVVAEPRQDILPDYLDFVRGVVDVETVPQQLTAASCMEMFVEIGRLMVPRILDMLNGFATADPPAYAFFYGAFAAEILSGLQTEEDRYNRRQLARLLRFQTSHTLTHAGEDPSSLSEYIRRMRQEQDAIYFAVAETAATANAQPLVQTAVADGFEVLLVTPPCEPTLLFRLEDFEGFPFIQLGRPLTGAAVGQFLDCWPPARTTEIARAAPSASDAGVTKAAVSYPRMAGATP